jgi:hypothetical protein
MRKNRLPLLLTLGVVTAIAGRSIAAASSTTVSLAALAGSRTMALSTLSGSNLATMSLGSAREAPFLVNVSDLAYDRKGYQVSAMMSNLYLSTGLSTFDCTKSISAENLSIGFVTSPSSVRDVAVTASPVLNFAGSITGSLATLLGLNPLSSTPMATSVSEQLTSFATSTVFSGAESALPVRVTTGLGGVFSSPAPHASCDTSPSQTPASVLLQEGTTNTVSDVFDWVQSSANSAIGTSASAAVSSGLRTQSDLDAATRTALLDDLGISSALVDATGVLGQVEAVLVAVSAPVSDILRQSGSYSTLPKLVVGDTSGATTGTYKGTLTITLIDTP